MPGIYYSGWSQAGGTAEKPVPGSNTRAGRILVVVLKGQTLIAL